MRIAKRNELAERTAPLLTAHVTARELTRWFGDEFEEITDPESTPEPSKGALFELSQGLYFVVYWGESSKVLTIQVPAPTDSSAFLAAFLSEVPLRQSQILWRRAGVDLPGRRTESRVVGRLKSIAQAKVSSLQAPQQVLAEKNMRASGKSKRAASSSRGSGSQSGNPKH